MHNILILSASIRTGRKSYRVAQYFRDFIETNKLGVPTIADLAAYNFPLFEERLRFQQNPSPDVLQFAEMVRNADGVLIVTPEYNGGYPASLKNAIDLLIEEWYHKPVAISTVSSGAFAGSQVLTSLSFSLWKIKALIATAVFPVPKVEDAFDENGNAKDKDATDKRANAFLRELVWMMEAAGKMKS